MSKTFLRRRAVEAKTGLSRSDIYAKMQRSEFPRAIRLSSRVVVWIESEIEEWMVARIDEARRCA